MSRDEEARRIVLARRARFVGAALAGIAGCGPARANDQPIVVPVAVGPSTDSPRISTNDRDGDGIADDDDLCPNDPEDLDGFEDADGCPDPDNDKDGVPDNEDRCPNVPGGWGKEPIYNGCPQAIARVCLSIIVVRKIEFDPGSATPLPTAVPMLDETAQVMNGNARTTLEVEGHTDDTESPQLGQARADAVVSELVARGVSRSRLTTVNSARKRPLDVGKTPEARARNRRVEFHMR
jgi:outer membrane protein OmpA-like peptidoglycan-associated protein